MSSFSNEDRWGNRPLTSMPLPSYDQVFLLDPANRAFLDGQSALPVFSRLASGNTMLLGVLPVIMLIGMIYFLYVGLYPIISSQLLDRNPVSTAAQITKLYTTTDTYNNINGYHVAYTYSAGTPPTTYTGDQDVPASYYTSFKVGQTTPITYVSFAPTISRLTSVKPLTLGELFRNSILPFIFALFLLIFAFAFGSSRRSTARAKEVLAQRISNIRLVPGEVIACDGQKTEDGYLVTLNYRYWPPSPGSNPENGTVSKFRNDLRKKENLPPPGRPLIICYFDEPVQIRPYGTKNVPRRDFVL